MPDGLIDPVGDNPEGQARRMSASALMEAHEPALWGMDEAEVVRARVGRDQAWGMTVRVLGEFEELRGSLAETYAPGRVAQIEGALAEVEARALVLAMAELRRASAQARSSTLRRDRVELAARVRNHDVKLSAWASVMALSYEEDFADVLEDIRRGQGYRDDAEDTLRLVELLRPRVGELTGAAALSDADLDQAEADATALLTELGREAPQQERTPQELVNRAYSAWQAAYLVLVRAGRDLTFGEKQARVRFPKPSPNWGQAPRGGQATRGGDGVPDAPSDSDQDSPTA